MGQTGPLLAGEPTEQEIWGRHRRGGRSTCQLVACFYRLVRHVSFRHGEKPLLLLADHVRSERRSCGFQPLTYPSPGRVPHPVRRASARTTEMDLLPRPMGICRPTHRGLLPFRSHPRPRGSISWQHDNETSSFDTLATNRQMASLSTYLQVYKHTRPH